MSKPRILVLENSVGVTGALTSAVRSAELLNTEFDYVFIVPKGVSAAHVRQHGFKAIELPMREIRKNLLSIILYLPQLFWNLLSLRGILRREKIDLILSNDFYNMLPPLYKVFCGGLPYLCFVRFIPSRFPFPLVGVWTFLHDRYASKIIPVSQVVSTELKHQEKVTVVYNEFPNHPVDFAEPSGTIILYPANFTIGKGQDYALEAFATIVHQFPGWRLRFVGGDLGLKKNRLYMERLKRRSQELKIEDLIIWAGFSTDMSKEYLEAAVVLNFSDSESFSLTCLEAMYYGRPVIATRCGGPEEIIDHPRSGLLVPVKSIPEMSSSLAGLLADSEGRRQLARNAYHEVRKRFDQAKTKDTLLILFLQALGQK